LIKIHVFSANRPDFIELQKYTFDKHLKEDYKFVVFNNAQFDSTGGADYDGVHAMGRKLGIEVIDIQKDADLIARCQAIELSCSLFAPQGTYSNANVAHAYAFCWAWENHISKEKGAIAILDSDVFLIQPTKLTDTLYPHQICNIWDGKSHPDGDIHYMWPTFVLIDMDRFPDPQTLNWWCGRIKDTPVDVGGQTYHYFKAHPELDVLNIRRLNSHYLNTDSCDFTPPNYDEFYLGDAVVLHYRSGSDWDHKGIEYHKKKTAWLKRRIESGQ